MGARSCKLLLIGTDSGLITVGLPASGSTSFVFCKLQQIHSPVTNLPLSQDSISEDPYLCFRAIYPLFDIIYIDIVDIIIDISIV